MAKRIISNKETKLYLRQLIKKAESGDLTALKKLESLARSQVYKSKFKKSNRIDKQPHISDHTPFKSAVGGLTIKSFAEAYGWKGRADTVLERLKSLGFTFFTQLDYISDEAKEAFAKSVGYDSFIEFKEARRNITNTLIEAKTVDDVAEKVEMYPYDLYSKLMYEHAKNKSNLLTKPVMLGTLAAACNMKQSTLVKCIQTPLCEIRLNYYSLINTVDIEIFLTNVKKLKWNYGNCIPTYLEPYVDALLKDVIKAKNNKFIAQAKSRELNEGNFYQEYEHLTLEELGKLYSGGKNVELEDYENDVIKKLINKKLL